MFSVRQTRKAVKVFQHFTPGEFGDVDCEIKTQIVQNGSSLKLRTKALKHPS